MDHLRHLASWPSRSSPSSSSTASSGSRPTCPLNPDHLAAVAPALSFNTAVSFLTNTNWQNYAGEDTMSQFTQMAGLAVQNFVSAAVGIAVAVALIRGLTRKQSNTLGNFWVDLTRIVIRVLIPIAVVAAIILIAQGAEQNLHATHMLTTVYRPAPGDRRRPGRLPGGDQAAGDQRRRALQRQRRPPLREPDRPDQPAVELAAALHPVRPGLDLRQDGQGPQAGLRRPRRHGRPVRHRCRCWSCRSRPHGNVHVTQAHVSQAITSTSPGGNMEGKEVRNGPIISALFNSSSTGTSTGSINSANDSYTPLGGGVLLFNMMLGEVSPGGTGSGLYGMLIMAILAVFIAGLMVGRTPEYLGKKIQAQEMKLVVLYLLMVPFVILLFTAISVVMHVVAGLDLQPRAPRAHRGDLRLHLARPTTTARRSPDSTATPTGTTPRSASACWSAGSP